MWAAHVGDDSYNFDKLLPYLKNSIDFTVPDNAIRAPNASVQYNPNAFQHGAGPLRVSIPIWANPFSSFAKIGFQEIGIKAALDFVSGFVMGVQYNMNTIDPRTQTRSSSESSFLRLVRNDTNLQVYRNSLAKKLLFHGKLASGVLVRTAGAEYTLFARTEVIISAGAVSTSVGTHGNS